MNPADESTTRASHGRNTAFALRLAAGLELAGAETDLGTLADVKFEYEGLRVFIECKRPARRETLRNNIEKAHEQLTKRLNHDEHSSAVGFVGLSVSRAVNAGAGMFVTESEVGLKQLHGDLQSVHDENGYDFDNLLDLRIVGNLYQLFTPAFIEDEGILVSASQSFVVISGPALQGRFPVSRGEPLKELLRRALSG